MRTIIWITLFLLLILPVRSQEKRVSLLFAGDAMQHLPQIVGAKGNHDSYHYDSCFYLLKEKIRSVDLAGLNFETTLGGEPYSGYPIFSAPDAFIQTRYHHRAAALGGRIPHDPHSATEAYSTPTITEWGSHH